MVDKAVAFYPGESSSEARTPQMLVSLPRQYEAVDESNSQDSEVLIPLGRLGHGERASRQLAAMKKP
jgi:hypothetical protein